MNPQDNSRDAGHGNDPNQYGHQGQHQQQGQQHQQYQQYGQQPAYQQQNGQQQQNGNHPPVVWMARPHEPQKPHISDEVRKRHEDSKAKYPFLNLSEGEFVIKAVKRHPIGLVQIWAGVIIVIAALMTVMALLVSAGLTDGANGAAIPASIVAIPVALLSLLALIFGFIATSVYNANEFYLTNESVIQLIQSSLFSKREQTVSLSNIEDASYTQHGIIPHLFNYGMIRLSTEGDETTYRFNYASAPQKTIAVLNNAVEAFKNGRPVGSTD